MLATVWGLLHMEEGKAYTTSIKWTRIQARNINTRSWLRASGLLRATYSIGHRSGHRGRARTQTDVLRCLQLLAALPAPRLGVEAFDLVIGQAVSSCQRGAGVAGHNVVCITSSIRIRFRTKIRHIARRAADMLSDLQSRTQCRAGVVCGKVVARDPALGRQSIACVILVNGSIEAETRILTAITRNDLNSPAEVSSVEHIGPAGLCGEGISSAVQNPCSAI